MVNQILQDPRKRKLKTAESPKELPATTLKSDSLEIPKQVVAFPEGFERATKLYTGLQTEIKEIQSLLTSMSSNNSLIDVKKTWTSISDIHSKALKFLDQASNIYRQTTNTNYEELLYDNMELETRLKECEPGTALYRTVVSAIDKNKSLMDLIKHNKDKTDELLYQVDICKDAMSEVRLSLPELVGHQSTDELQQSVTNLKNRVEFAQRLGREFDSQGL